MTVIKAPYNFVPLSQKVVTPYWAQHISHDIPFKEGRSGTITLKITARSPLYVRDGSKENKQDKDAKAPPAFFNAGSNYYLPGSSIKGMLRSVLEILSFGKLANKVNDHRYAFRDFENQDLYNKIDFLRNVECGWLSKAADGSYQLEKCDKPGRIALSDISPSAAKYYEKGGGFDHDTGKNSKVKDKDALKTAESKYERLTGISLDGNFSKDTVANSKRIRHDKRISYLRNEAGERAGTIVLTGQSSARNNVNGSGKKYEFIFFKPAKKATPLSEDLMNKFRWAHYDDYPEKQASDWKWRKGQLEAGQRIPVFYRYGRDGIQDMGLAFLYKLAYDHTIAEAADKFQKNQRAIDLGEAIFGYIADEKAGLNDSLKGRVHIGHAKASHAEKDTTRDDVVLGSPKASYYPSYIRQNIKNGRVSGPYQTLNSRSPELAGWKRYPVQAVLPAATAQKLSNDKVATDPFTPLKAGATFECHISYHNLKLVELGALLSAISFHNTPNTFHSIGLAKPLGYGKIEVRIEHITEAEQVKALQAFESYMDFALQNAQPEWHQSPQIRELLTMASEQKNSGNSSLKYMKLEEGNSDFAKAKDKKNPQALDRYSELNNIKSTRIPEAVLIRNGDYEKLKSDFEQDAQAFKQLSSTADLLEQQKQSLRQNFEAQAKAYQKALLEQLELKLAATEAEALEANRQKKAEASAKARDTAWDFGNIKPKLKDLSNFMEKEFRNRHSPKKYKEVEKDFPDGFLPEATMPDFEQCLIQIFGKVSDKDKAKRWLVPYDKCYPMKTVAKWTGEARAKTLLDKLKTL